MTDRSDSRHLQATEARGLNFQHLFDTMLTPYMIMDRDLVIVYANAAYLQNVERSLDELVGKYIFDAFPDTEERVAPVRDAFLRTGNGETTQLERQYYHFTHADGTTSTKCWQCLQTPYIDGDGQVSYIVQNSEDITEADALRQRNEVIAKELDHRVKNLFSIIQAVAALAGHTAETVDEFRTDFSGRIMSMSRTHNSLASGEWEGMLLSDVFENELEQYGGASSPRISFSGPALTLGTKATQDASMIIHEYATNAAKYGALAGDRGRLDISWAVKDTDLVVDWHESGLVGIKQPNRIGFGSQLTQFMPNVSETRDYREDGLRLTLRVPLPVVERSSVETA
jgi:PAS domain S-box-containing protein